MHREYHKWHSPSLGRDMELLIFGHGGARVIVYPTSQGRFYEWQDRGMHHALGEHLERGWIQLYCVDSVDAESWYSRWKHPVQMAERQEQYERYVLDEVLPLSAHKNPTPYVIATGASFGAYHAAALAFRHPHRVNRMLGLSGLYDIREIMGDYYDGRIQAHNPSDFVRHERDPWRLEALRRQDIILVTGRDDRFRGNNEWMSQVLWEKGVGNALRLWDGWAHDWPWWHEMVVRYIGGHD
jgi:esterase/lipase superfamily enzyme